MKIEFVAAVDAAEILAVPVFEDRTFTAAGTALDGKANGALTNAAGKLAQGIQWLGNTAGKNNACQQGER